MTQRPLHCEEAGKAWGPPAFMGAAVSPPQSNDIEARLGAHHRTLYFSSRCEVPTGSENGVAAEQVSG